MTQLWPSFISYMYVSAPVALCALDHEGRYIIVNQAYADLVGVPAANFGGRHVSDLLPAVIENVERDNRALAAHQTIPDHEISINGQAYLVSVHGIYGDTGSFVGSSIALTNIQKQKILESQLSDLVQELETFAWTDALTGLPNRRFFEHTLQKELARSRRDGTPLSLLMIDVDHFKSYNDRYGHPAGDRCLQSVAEAIRSSVRRPSDSPSRIGGEEFSVILPATTREGALVVAKSIQQSVASSGLAHGASPFSKVTVSIGIGCLSDVASANEPNSILNIADSALYAAKNAGRNLIWSKPQEQPAPSPSIVPDGFDARMPISNPVD